MREAACHCGQLRLAVQGDPFVVSLCHCLACQRRTGSAFGIQAGFRAEQVTVAGRSEYYARISDEEDRKEHAFRFCPDCGSTVFYEERDVTVVMVGAFADPSFPPRTESGYDHRRHHWLTLRDTIQRPAPELWEPARELYDAGRYTEAADRGRAVLEEHPGLAYLHYNVACCESLAGRVTEAVEHLGRAIEGWPGCREMAQQDSDFDALRSHAAFEALVGV
jgi:hypothetical protein